MPAIIQEGVQGFYGCSVYSMHGFPWGSENAYTAGQLDDLKKLIKGCSNLRGYILSLNSNQLAAKKILEDAGFKVIGVTHSAHIDHYPDQIAEWHKTKNNDQTIYLMGRGFYDPVEAKPFVWKVWR